MVNVKKLSGGYLKSLLGAKRVRKTYHNHNKSGGNFGFVIVMNSKSSRRGDGEEWYRIDGVHNLEGEVSSLRFSNYGSWTPEGDKDLQVLYKKLFDAGLFNYGAW